MGETIVILGRISFIHFVSLSFTQTDFVSRNRNPPETEKSKMTSFGSEDDEDDGSGQENDDMEAKDDDEDDDEEEDEHGEKQDTMGFFISSRNSFNLVVISWNALSKSSALSIGDRDFDIFTVILAFGIPKSSDIFKPYPSNKFNRILSLVEDISLSTIDGHSNLQFDNSRTIDIGSANQFFLTLCILNLS